MAKSGKSSKVFELDDHGEDNRLTVMAEPPSLSNTIPSVATLKSLNSDDSISLDMDYTGYEGSGRLDMLAEAEEEGEEELSPEQKQYNKGVTRTFGLLIAIQIIINYDSGAIAYSLLLLKTKWDMNESEAGLLTSLVYIGLVISSLYAGWLFMHCNAKLVLCGGICVNIIANVLFGVCPSTAWALSLRVIIGMSQAFLVIYAPVWVDEFSPPGKITLWMSLMQGGVPIGIMVGYLVAGIIVPLIVGNITVEDDLDDSATFAKLMLPYFLQSILLLPLVITLFYVPSEYVDTRISMALRHAQQDDDGHIQEIVDIIDGLIQEDLDQTALENSSYLENSQDRDTKDHGNSSSVDESAQKAPIHQTKVPNVIEETEYKTNDYLTVYDDNNGREGNTATSSYELRDRQFENCADAIPTKGRITKQVRTKRIELLLQDKWGRIWEQSKYLLFNGLFLSCMGALCALYFVVTGLQMWITRYFTEFIGSDPFVVTIAFSVVSATGPLTGVIAGGIILDCFGGYRGVDGMIMTCKVCTGFGICAVAAAYFIIFLHTFWANIVLIWFLLAFGGAIVPGATGVLMSSVPQRLRAFASSVATLVYNLFGYFLGPTICGVVAEQAGGVQYGFWIVMAFSTFGAVFMGSAWLFAWKNRDNLDALQPDVESLRGEMVPMNENETAYEVARRQSFAGFAVLLQQSRRSRTHDVVHVPTPKRSATRKRNNSLIPTPTVQLDPTVQTHPTLQTDFEQIHRSESVRRKSCTA